MGKEKDYVVDDLIKSADDLLDTIAIGNLEIEGAAEIRKRVADDARSREFEELRLEEAPSADGAVRIHVSKDDMLVTADFYPPSGPGRDIDEEDVKDRLDMHGVVAGIDWVTIRENIEECNSTREQRNGIVVASGIKPEDEVPQQFVVEESLQQKITVPEDEENSRVDFKERTSYTLVKKGEMLARIVPKREGTLGKTVKGELVPYKKASVVQKKPGRNTALEKETVVATTDGRFEVWNNHFWVHEVFEVMGDVGYNTGNITFPGDIIIHGRVNDGFRVEAEGSIICRGTLDASDVTCKRDLQVFRGIIGRQKGKISVGGTIRAKYIENSYAEADGSIYIENGILHSIVRTNNRLEMGKKSIVAGGKVYAQNGVRVDQIGTKMGIKTEIHCGVDYKVQQNLEWIKDKSVALALKLSQVEERIKTASGEKKELLRTRDRLKKYIHKLNHVAKSLVVRLDKNSKADVVVSGTVFPGVYIEICRKSYLVPHEMEGVRFFLDKEGGVDVEPIL
jgi:uncharacterized protein (DUF342 family)